MASFDAVVTHHLDGFRSGVARFNEVLARHLRVPLVPLDGVLLRDTERPLLSFKASELDASAEACLRERLDHPWSWTLFLHEYRDVELERRLASGARCVLCGNAEIRRAVERLNPRIETVWTPGLLLDDRAFPTAEITVFSFGMAHKLRIDMFERLRALLDATGRSYAVYVSAANHETASLRESEEVFEALHRVFPSELRFLGNLSDVAILDWLRRTTFFAAFFPGGVRANNTSVASALERGAVVITNLDEYSPPWMRHLETVIDINACDVLPTDPQTAQRIATQAMDTSRGLSWESLLERMERATESETPERTE